MQVLSFNIDLIAQLIGTCPKEIPVILVAEVIVERESHGVVELALSACFSDGSQRFFGFSDFGQNPCFLERNLDRFELIEGFFLNVEDLKEFVPIFESFEVSGEEFEIRSVGDGIISVIREQPIRGIAGISGEKTGDGAPPSEILSFAGRVFEDFCREFVEIRSFCGAE